MTGPILELNPLKTVYTIMGLQEHTPTLSCLTILNNTLSTGDLFWFVGTTYMRWLPEMVLKVRNRNSLEKGPAVTVHPPGTQEEKPNELLVIFYTTIIQFSIHSFATMWFDSATKKTTCNEQSGLQGESSELTFSPISQIGNYSSVIIQFFLLQHYI